MDHEHMEHEAHEVHVRPVESAGEYVKFIAVIAAIALVSLLLTSWRKWSLDKLMEDFMAIFFITFAGFKFVNIEMFAKTYRMYDVVTRKFPAWGYIFPFVEAALGFAYLLTTKNVVLNVITMLITGIAGYGVWQELRLNATRRRKGQFMCACLGTVIRLPLSKVSLIEDFLMFMMALVMLLLI